MTAAYLDRFVDEQRLLAASERREESEDQVAYLRYMSQTGRRVAELHMALAGNKELRRFRAGADPARGYPALDRRHHASAAERIFDTLRHRRDTLRRPTVRWSTSCWRSKQPCRIA